jgi:hypothetical protein
MERVRWRQQAESGELQIQLWLKLLLLYINLTVQGGTKLLAPRPHHSP